MNRKFRKFIITFAFTMVFSCAKVYAESSYVECSSKTNISTNKEWTIKFSDSVDSTTVINKNISVVDENNKTIPVSIKVGNKDNIVIVSPTVSGYDPSKKYKLIVGKELKSKSGKSLEKTVMMDFSTINKYEDGTSYDDLPKIDSLKFEFAPLLPSQKQGFLISTKNGQDVQYRIFVSNKVSAKDNFIELTNGYTSAVDGKITSINTLDAKTNGQQYKVIVYVKRANVEGAHKDSNTDFDNYYVDYMRCVNEISSDDSVYHKYDVTLDKLVDVQDNLRDKSVFVDGYKFDNVASKNQIKYYMNPNNFLDDYGKYQFLKLSYTEGLNADQINDILKGKGILEGKGQLFLDAAKSNNISVEYLVSHSLLETGNGTSVLANGGLKKEDGSYFYGMPVYNFFGIGAIDDNANYYGTKKAYDLKWVTPEDAIQGGAKWISSGYINNAKAKQDTLYKMKWNPDNSGEHQYATDVGWAYKQIDSMRKGIKEILDSVKNIHLTFEIPQFK